MAKEIRFNSPDSKHPGSFTLSDLKDLIPEAEVDHFTVFEVAIDWQSGTYGSRVPVVVITRAPEK